MNSSTTNIVKEIAEQLDCGYRAFIHKKTRQLIFIPDEDKYPDIDIDFEPWEKEIKELENNSAYYYEIEKWSSSQAFEMMSEFADQLSDKNLQRRLFNALRKNKPFRNFKFIIDNSGKYRQQWFDFKNKWQQDFVARQLNRLKLTDE